MQTPGGSLASLDGASAETQATQEAKQAANLDLDQLAGMEVKTHGLSLFTELRPVGRRSLSAGLTETRGVATAGTEGVDTPRHILNLQSRLDLTGHFNFDANYYYYDAISELKLPTLNRVHVGFSTNRISGFTFSIWGRNLQSAHHLENNTGEPYFPAGEVRRALVLELRWRSNTE